MKTQDPNAIRFLSGKRGVRMACLLAFILCWLGLSAATPIEHVSGEYTYYDNGNHTRNECIELAKQGARVDALAKKFGTIVSQDVSVAETGRNGREETSFFSNSLSSVRGEWISDEGEPKIEVSLDPQGNLVVKCSIKGTARKLGNSSIEFNANLVSAPDKRAKATDFDHGQNFYLWVESPEHDVHLLVCLIDQEGEVYKLFPYPDQNRPTDDFLKKGYDYILFDRGRPSEHGEAEEMVALAPDGVELNKLYVIASPNAIGNAKWQYNGPRMLSSMKLNDFNEWLTKLVRNDEQAARKQFNLKIMPPHGESKESHRY